MRHFERNEALVKPTFLLLPIVLLAACSKSPAPSSSRETGAGIIGGETAKIDSAGIKSVVMVFNTKIKSLCTGTLIADDMILTAAHCVVEETETTQVEAPTLQDPNDIRAVFGLSPFTATNPTLRKVTMVRPHEKYTGKETSADLYDIALVRFEGGRPTGTEIALLPDGPPSDVIVPFRAIGYGRSNGLLNKATSSTNPTGAGVLRVANLKAYFLFDHDREFVVDQTAGSGICLGDSGGPALVRRTDGKDVVIGVVSRVIASGQTEAEEKDEKFNLCAHSSIYTSVSGFTSWIRSSITKMRSR